MESPGLVRVTDFGVASGVEPFGRQRKTFQGKGSSNSRDPEKVCNYCHKRAHWKVDCLLLKLQPKKAAFGSHVTGVGLAAPVPQVFTSDGLNSDLHVKDSGPMDLDPYWPFIHRGF